MSDPVYVSITGLALKSPWQAPRFWLHALRSMAQARRAPGNLSADARRIDGVHHTLTTWQSRADMLAFVHSRAHAKAVRAFPHIATGKTLGYMAAQAPDWHDVPQLWREKGRAYVAH